MIAAIKPSSTKVETARGDFRTLHYDKTWEQFEHLKKGFEGSRGVRLFYYDGTIEILMPGRAHEIFKGLIGFLIELFLYHKRVDFLSIGSTTQEKAGLASAEPDESYELEGFTLTVEVNFTSGDISKLERYKALHINEVWIWEDGVLDVYHLEEGDYKRVDHSLIPALASLNLQVMSECILLGEASRIEAVDKLIAAHFG